MPDAGCVAVWHTPAWAPSTLTWRYGIADVLDFCADDVPVGDQDVVADRADGFEGAAPASDRVIARTQIGVFGACGGLCRLGEHGLERDRAVAGSP